MRQESHGTRRGTANPAIRDTLASAIEGYKRALIGHQAGLVWDYVVLTAANEHQAAGFRHELEVRSAGMGPLGAFFPPSQQTLAVADPPGFRAGSGGATFGVLRAIGAHQKAIGDRKPFDALRILVVHSGGASQRIPQLSPLGKIFAPLPMVRPDGAIMTLFDHLYLMAAGLPARLGPGMLVAAGDVFLLFDGATVPCLSAPPTEARGGIVALSMRVPAEMGEAHGVFVVEGPRGRGGKGSRKEGPWQQVAACLQKATTAEMRAAGATDARGNVLIDSGLLFFDAQVTTALHELSARYTPAWQSKVRREIDLYSDIVPATLGDGVATTTHDPVRRKLHADLRAKLDGAHLRCFELPAAYFLHLGTTRQFRDAMVGLDPTPAAELFLQNARVASESVIPPTARVYQSVITGGQVQIEDDVVIENCQLGGDLAIGRGSVLSGLALERNGAKEKVRIPADTLIFGVPLAGGGGGQEVTVIAGVHDDFKTDRTLCNTDLRHWMMLAGITEADLWPGAREAGRSLWTAKLYPGKPMAIGELLWMTQPGSVTAGQRAAWRKARRYSMADILELVDAAALARHRDAISGRLEATQWIAAVTQKTAGSVQNTINHFGPSGYQNLLGHLHAAANAPTMPPLLRARLLWSEAELASRPGFPKDEVKVAAPTSLLQKQTFACIQQAMAPDEHRARGNGKEATRFEGHAQTITASAPVRLDLAGGWTDTPPYCLENGGAVVNVAVDLNGTEPICSQVRRLEEPIVRLVSRDLGRTLIVTDPRMLNKPAEPGDPFALQMVALRLTGVGPRDGEDSQRKWLGRLNRAGSKFRGFELSTASNLPKGSGMGTSSILGATTLAVLRAATGQDTKPATLFEQTSLLEQFLGTGGGWQDQVGGIIGGAKITETKPGIPQTLKVRQIPLSNPQARALEERLVVYFTGQQRLARNILREVMGRYLSREPGTMVLFHELAACARALENALRRLDWMTCATEINRYWRIKRDLFAGSTTPAIDGLFLELRPYYLGGGLAGAGGGGFAYFLCGDANQAHRLRTELHRISTRPGSLGLTFAAGINTRGLRIARDYD